jgi:4-amino-4-deoxy-L-arabinose transferase-like glycosyltransferase
MTEAVAAVRFRAQRVSIAVSADTVAVVALAALTVLLAVATWATWGDPGRDTGYDLVAGARVAHGQLPYVDFVYYYGPLAPFLLGLAAWLGGAGLGAAVALGLAVTAAIIAASYALARTQVGPLPSALVAALVAAVAFSPTNLSYVLPHTESAPLAVLCSLCFLLALSRYAERGRGLSLVAAGVFAGLVALTRPEFAVGIALAGLAWLAVRARAGSRLRREAALLGLPAIAVPAAVYGAFLTQMSLSRLAWDNLYPTHVLRAGGNHVLRSQAPLTIHSFARLGAYLVAYAIGVGALLVVSRLIGRLERRLAVASLGAIVALAAGLALVRSESLRYYLEYVFGWLPLGAVLAAAALTVVGLRRRSLTARDQVLVACLVLLAVVAVKTYDGFFFLATRAQPAVYTAPFVAVALARLHWRELAGSRATRLAAVLWLGFVAAACVGLTLKDAAARSARVTGPGGVMKVTPAEAPLYRAALAAIDSRTKPGEAILVAPQLSVLYTLSGRRDPLPQLSLLPGALPDAQAERQAIVRLERARVRVVVLDRHQLTEYGHTAFGGSFDRVLAAWVRSNFDHVATLEPGNGSVSHTLDIWLRRVS